MSKINRKRGGSGWLAWYIPLVFLEFVWLLALLLQNKNVAVFNPKGLIAQEQLSLLIFTLIVLFAVAIPVVLLLYFMAWKYRETNTKVKHDPHARSSKRFVLTIWTIPTVCMIVLLVVMYPATHRLEPKKTIQSDKEPVTVQVIAMRWKWVFLYPEQKIATVNFLQIPEDTPVIFELTADEAPMSSFWIPNLGGQLYTMTGHVNRLNLMADTPGDYPGISAEINGPGFADMKFTTRVSTIADFENWAKETGRSSEVLDSATYEELVKPSENNSQVFYRSYESDIYDKVVLKYMGSHDHETPTYEAHH